ncbi:hypothetical protein [Mucilaginibacter paludis]|uniref:Uncharacterized protein n=1 Tax=Mucilaginibacter paludis DSM 18603 TaxID=714943 RepID=H1Y1U1_9SPHI|nr:hypothetical protein [Mucilaginibacter paludis]EHQ24750.1 hypothetical protein Mucpa_0558 [Mucilaginibacter paludis DSM 18603]
MKRKAKRVIQNQREPRHDKPKVLADNHDGFGGNVPPDRMVVAIYFDQKDLPDCADAFLAEQELLQWKTIRGAPIRNWKVCAAEWIFNYRQEMKRKFRLSPFSSQSY